MLEVTIKYTGFMPGDSSPRLIEETFETSELTFQEDRFFLYGHGIEISTVVTKELHVRVKGETQQA